MVASAFARLAFSAPKRSSLSVITDIAVRWRCWANRSRTAGGCVWRCRCRCWYQADNALPSEIPRGFCGGLSSRPSARKSSGNCASIEDGGAIDRFFAQDDFIAAAEDFDLRHVEAEILSGEADGLAVTGLNMRAWLMYQFGLISEKMYTQNRHHGGNGMQYRTVVPLPIQ